MAKPFPEPVKKYIRERGCKPEYRNPAYDAICGEQRILIRRIDPNNCTVRLSIHTVQKAKETWSYLVVIDSEADEVLKLPIQVWLMLVNNLLDKEYYYMKKEKPCKIKFVLTEGHNGKRLCVTVSETTYKQLVALAKKYKEWEALLSDLLRYGYA